MDKMFEQMRRWREAHPQLQIPEEALKVAGPWPSLFANDFIVWLEARGTMPEVVQFVKDIHREMAWTYDNWKKTLHDSDASALMLDLLNSARGPGESAAMYAPIQKFLTDYAKANNIPLGKSDGASTWEGLLADLSQASPIVPEHGVEVVG